MKISELMKILAEIRYVIGDVPVRYERAVFNNNGNIVTLLHSEPKLDCELGVVYITEENV